MRLMKILILLFLFTNICLAQENDIKQKRKLDVVFSPGVILQNNLFGELNILVGFIKVEDGKIPFTGVGGLRLGVESNFRNGNNYIIAPKIGFEISALIFSARLSAINYFQNGNSEFRILPEVGFSLGGRINLTYGYGISLNDGNINGLSNHRLGLSFNLNKKLNKGIKEVY